MNQINLREARRKLGDIIAAAERGESTVITRRGRQVARIEPMQPAGNAPLPDLSDFRASLKVKGKPLSEVVIANRRGARY